MGNRINGKDLIKAGVPQGAELGRIIALVMENDVSDTKAFVKALGDHIGGQDVEHGDNVLAQAITILNEAQAGREAKMANCYDLNKEGCSIAFYGKDIIEQGAIDQIEIASKLPCAVQAACMPDAHQGYGLPIGGVLATDNAVIPYGVGVDIGCRMTLSYYDANPSILAGSHGQFKNVLVDGTSFGMGCENDGKTKFYTHSVLDDERFGSIPYVKKNNLRNKAIKQLGTSGGGNHFVEFGAVEIDGKEYVAILTHSGSRGVGANIANFYTKLAMEKCKLPKEAKHLAYLSLDSEEGQEYWEAMNLSGDFASACHHAIHDRLSKELKLNRVGQFENAHNLAWKEKLNDGREVIVHRKGATPAGKGVAGIIPGSMTTNTYIVIGKGDINSINSSSHGAGRAMSRKAAKDSYTESTMKKNLVENGVTLIGGDVDECTFAYKNIDDVMARQGDLVDIVGTFMPKIVRMAAD